jgi:Ca2+-binding EF-hand superfamily protein
LGYEAKRLGLPFAVGVIEYAQVAKPYNANLDQMKTMLNRFAKIDTNRDGLISEDDLVLFMKVPKDDNFVVFFEMLDVNKRGFITFGEYAEGLLKHSKPLLESEVHLQSIFNYFDRDSDNVLSTDDLSWLPKQSPDDEDVVIDYRTSSCCCSRNRSSHQRTRDIERGERREITAGPWDFYQFKELIKDNLDFLLFFHQSQNGGLLLPMANGSINSHMVTVVRE